MVLTFSSRMVCGKFSVTTSVSRGRLVVPPNFCKMYRAACKVELRPINRSDSQLTFFVRFDRNVVASSQKWSMHEKNQIVARSSAIPISVKYISNITGGP